MGPPPGPPHYPRVVAHDPSSSPAEAFRELRTALMLGDSRPRTILVTSALAGDGKTLVATNLAAAFAQAGRRVVLVDADLRRGRVSRQLGLDNTQGLSTLAGTDRDATAVLQRWNSLFDVLPSGPAVGNPSELLGSRLVPDTLAALAADADVVIIDAPPVIAVTDAVVLSAFVDAVVVVARHGVTAAGFAAESRRRLDRVGANVLGVVLNDVRSKVVHSYYADPLTAPANALLTNRD